MLMLDENAPDHEKVEGLTDRAFRGWIRALAWSARTGTDGRVPSQMPRRWDLRPSHIRELVSAGLWDENGSGWVIHDYHDFNPPTDPLARRRWYDARRKRTQRGRNADT